MFNLVLPVQAPLQLDTLPLRTLKLTTAPDGTELMVAHAQGRNGLGVWRLVRGGRVWPLLPLCKSFFLTHP